MLQIRDLYKVECRNYLWLIQESPKKLVRQFFDKTATSYELIVKLTTLRSDECWKEEIIKGIPLCSSVLDLACGTGILTFKIAGKFPSAHVTGVDITEGYLEVAKAKLKPHHKISFLLDDAEKLSLDKKFDCITASYLPKYCTPEVLIEKCLCHLNQGGKIILHDFTYPTSKPIRQLWNLYFIMLQVGRFFIPRWKKVFEELPKLIRSTNWVDRYKDIIERKGLDVEVRYLTLGCSAILTGTKKV